jgi:hypothetical protein
MTFVNPATMGLMVAEKSTVAQFPLGLVVTVAQTTYKYVKAITGAKTIGLCYEINKDNELSAAITTTTAALVQQIGIPQITLAANDFAWVAIQGIITVSVLASCAAGAQLYTTATAGSLDDATGGGVFAIRGFSISTANGGSTANVAGLAVLPLVTFS